MWKEKQIILNDHFIHFVSLATKNASYACIFLHGWRSDSSVWKEIISLLTKEPGLSFFCLDLPGFGKSQLPSSSFTLEDYSSIVSAFIQKMQLKKVVLIGHSFGGRISIKLASQKPTLINKLVLVDAAGFVNNSLIKKLKQSIAFFLKPFFTLSFMHPLRAKIYYSLGADDYVATPDLRTTFVNIVNEDLTSCLSYIHHPTLILWGEDDRDTPLLFAYRLKNSIRDSKLEIIKNAGHFSFLDKPNEFIHALIPFIRS